jgi:hypothetical protein
MIAPSANPEFHVLKVSVSRIICVRLLDSLQLECGLLVHQT